MWQFHAEAHEFLSQDSLGLSARKVASSSLAQFAVICFWLAGMCTECAFLSNYEAWVTHPWAEPSSAQVAFHLGLRSLSWSGHLFQVAAPLHRMPHRPSQQPTASSPHHHWVSFTQPRAPVQGSTSTLRSWPSVILMQASSWLPWAWCSGPAGPSLVCCRLPLPCLELGAHRMAF